MPSPFPGMDPFIEGQGWSSFHTRFITAIADAIVPQLRPRYVSFVEERIYLEHETEDERRSIVPDVSLVDTRPWSLARGGAATTTIEAPVTVPVPIPEEEHEPYLVIKRTSTLDVVTVIEVLSPKNKRVGADGRGEYLRKREAVLRSGVHLVELDLLRGGERLPALRPLPPADYYAFVSKEQRRPNADVWPWWLTQRMPRISIPLAAGDPDVELDIQAVFEALYDRAGYDYSLDYNSPVQPPLPDEGNAWVQEILAGRPKQ